MDSLNAVMTAGWSVTVSGVSFGASLDTTPTARLGLSDCGTAAWVSVTSVACSVTRGDGVEHVATVTAVGVVGTRTSTFSYDGDARRSPRGAVPALVLIQAELSRLFCSAVSFQRQGRDMTLQCL